MIRHLAVALLLVTVAASCAKKPAPPAAPQQLPAMSFSRAWDSPLPVAKDDRITRLFLRDELLIAYTEEHNAFVVGKDGGVLRFSTKITGSAIPPQPPAVLKERIVFPTNSTLEVYSRNGREHHSEAITHSPRTGATALGTRIYIGVDSQTGGRLVTYETIPTQYKQIPQRWNLMSTKGAAVTGAPAAMNGVVYVAFEDGKVYAINADSSNNIWSTSTGATFNTFGPIEADVRVDEYGLYVASTDTKLYCLDRATGKIKWQFFANLPLRYGPETTSTTVYQLVTGMGLVAVDKVTGEFNRKPRWAVADAVKFLAEDELHSYLQRKDNTIMAVNKTTGQLVFTSQRKDLTTFVSNTKDNTIYAATKDGHLLAITPLLKPGTVGELVMIERPLEIAAAK